MATLAGTAKLAHMISYLSMVMVNFGLAAAHFVMDVSHDF